MSIKIALIGYGKMGKAIEAVAVEKGHPIVLTIDLTNQHQFTQENLQLADVAIEFTSPASAFNNVMRCLSFGIPVVCGSTGWLHQLPLATEYCLEKKGCLLYASNFSVGVNIFFEINKRLATLMRAQASYNIQLEEIHHTQKKDAPSGTAVSLAEQIMENISRKKNWVNQASTQAATIPIISKRIDTAPGTHSVAYTSEIDTIEIIHTAHSRTGFATGAVMAAEFIVRKKGIFGMKEVLGL
jgi:4-hydroxy-tetrahydrodipicolinate reductase